MQTKNDLTFPVITTNLNNTSTNQNMNQALSYLAQKNESIQVRTPLGFNNWLVEKYGKRTMTGFCDFFRCDHNRKFRLKQARPSLIKVIVELASCGPQQNILGRLKDQNQMIFLAETKGKYLKNKTPDFLKLLSVATWPHNDFFILDRTVPKSLLTTKLKWTMATTHQTEAGIS